MTRNLRAITLTLLLLLGAGTATAQGAARFTIRDAVPEAGAADREAVLGGVGGSRDEQHGGQGERDQAAHCERTGQGSPTH